MSRLRLGVVGVGHLGKEHARILAGLSGVHLVGVADVNLEQARAVADRYSARAFSDHRPLIGGVDAAVLAVPTRYHLAVARDFLSQGVPLLIEKPLTLNVAEADELLTLAARKGTLIQVGHIERFNPAFEELQRRPLRPHFISCHRHSGFSGRSTDIGAVLDLMIHDLDLLLTLIGEPVQEVHASGLTLLDGHEDVAHAHVVFANGCVAHLSASRINPTPFRQMQVWGPQGHACLDFARRQLTLSQPAGVSGGRPLQVLELDRNQGDQLTRELEDFVRCVRTGSRPRVSGADGRAALALAGRILEQTTGHAVVPGRGDVRQPLFHLPVQGELAA